MGLKRNENKLGSKGLMEIVGAQMGFWALFWTDHMRVPQIHNRVVTMGSEHTSEISENVHD